MYSAASAGMTCSTEPAAAPTARVRRMSRREMDSFMGGPHNCTKKDLTQRARSSQSAQRRGGKESDGRGKSGPYDKMGYSPPRRAPLQADARCRDRAQQAAPLQGMP